MTVMEGHTPKVPSAIIPLDAGVELWCGRCQAITNHHAAHLALPESGAPRCVTCSKWVGFQCDKCHAIGPERQ